MKRMNYINVYFFCEDYKIRVLPVTTKKQISFSCKQITKNMEEYKVINNNRKEK